MNLLEYFQDQYYHALLVDLPKKSTIITDQNVIMTSDK